MQTINLGPCECCGDSEDCATYITQGLSDVLFGASTAYMDAFRVSDSYGFNSSEINYDRRGPASVGSNKTRISWFNCAPQTLPFAQGSTYFENFPLEGFGELYSSWFLRHGTGCYLRGEPPPITTSDLSFSYCSNQTASAPGSLSAGVRFYVTAFGSNSHRPVRIEKDGAVIPATPYYLRPTRQLTLDTGVVFEPVEWMTAGTFRFFYDGMQDPVEFWVGDKLLNQPPANPLP